MLKIYNTLAREKQVFTPIVAGKVSMYVCGMTVYDYCHLGHARVMVVFDMVGRWLRASGYELKYVRNITDIDDKIIKRANENQESIGQLTQRFIDAMDQDAASLSVIKPDIEPKATDFCRGHGQHDCQLDREGLCLRGRQRRRVLLGQSVCRIRKIVRQILRGLACRRARGSRYT